MRDRSQLGNVIIVVIEISGVQHPSSSDIFSRQITQKAKSIIAYVDHPLSKECDSPQVRDIGFWK